MIDSRSLSKLWLLVPLSAVACSDPALDAGAATNSATIAPVVTAMPNSDLLDGQAVLVRGEGLTPGSSVYAATCSGAVAVDYRNCAGFVSGQVGADGSVLVSLKALRAFTPHWDTSRDVSCELKGACFVGLEESHQDGTSQYYFTPIEFRDVGPVPPRNEAVQVTPSSDLVDLQSVTATLNGFWPHSTAVVRQCPANAQSLGECLEAKEIEVDGAGNGSATLDLYRAFEVANNVVRREVTCEVPGSCVVHAHNLVPPTSNDPFEQPVPPGPAAALSFRNIGPVQKDPEVVVNPSHDLFDAKPVLVSGKGFWPHATLWVAQCRVNAQVFWTECRVLGNARTDGSGTFVTSAAPTQSLDPYGADPFLCDAAQPCELIVGSPLNDSIVFESAVRVPVTFLPIGSPRRGTLHVSASSIITGDTVRVEGSGWAAFATLETGFCTGPNFYTVGCGGNYVTVHADAEGKFAADIATSRYLPTYSGGSGVVLVDCAAEPGACKVAAYDRRDRNPQELPLTLSAPPDPDGSEIIDQDSPLVAGATVRLAGRNWQPNRSLSLHQCKDSNPGDPYYGSSWCNHRGTVTTDASGSFRTYAELLGSFPVVFGSLDGTVDCASGCTLLVSDSVNGATARIPLQFQAGEQVDVVSSYEPSWQGLLDQGVQLSGLIPGELQRQGAFVLSWVMAASGVQTGAPAPRSGTIQHVTRYTVADYIALSRLAANYGYTVEELQKSGALFWSWLLAGRPPLGARSASNP